MTISLVGVGQNFGTNALGFSHILEICDNMSIYIYIVLSHAYIGGLIMFVQGPGVSRVCLVATQLG